MGSVRSYGDLRGSILRIYAEVGDQINKELDQAAISKGSNKKLLVAEAIDLYLHQDRSQLDLIIKERDLLRSQLDLIIKEKDQLRSEQDLKWKETQQIRSELYQAKRELEAARSMEDQLRSERDLARSSEDQVSSEVEGLRKDLEHFKDALRLKDDEISFLRGHLSQISEKLPKSLPPSQEEAKKKGWWQFWR
jgi:chromosome segregation ATPase